MQLVDTAGVRGVQETDRTTKKAFQCRQRKSLKRDVLVSIQHSYTGFIKLTKLSQMMICATGLAKENKLCVATT